MSNEEFKIPEMAYKIPLKEFFVWYDTLLAKQWNAMGAEERNKYFAKADLEELKNTALEKLGEHYFQDVHITDIQKAVTVSNIMDLKDHPLLHTDAQALLKVESKPESNKYSVIAYRATRLRQRTKEDAMIMAIDKMEKAAW